MRRPLALLPTLSLLALLSSGCPGAGDVTTGVTQGTCGAAGAACPEGQTCAEGRCAPCPCLQSGVCQAGTVCDLGACECVIVDACEAHDDCPLLQRCEAGRCAPDEGCVRDADCVAIPGAACMDGRCVVP